MAVVQGNRQHDAADRGSPVKIGGKAATSAPSDVGDGDRVDAYFDLKGRQVVVAVDSAGNSIGGGTQYTEADTDSSITGTAILWEDTSDTLRAVSAAKPLPVTGGQNIFTDDAAFTPGSSSVGVIGAQADETATDSVDEGDAGALRMTLARELYVKEGRSSSSAVTTVADSASSTQLLAAAAGRKGFRITNDSSALLYVKFGTTASLTDYTVRLATGDYLEDNFYTGRVDGIWATDPGDGAARITELT